MLTVDASPVDLGAVFNPEDPNERQVVSCISRMLTEVERRYSQCEKEALGVVWGCERLWIYLLGKHFIIETDNRAVKLIFANTKSPPPARIERLALRLSQFDYEIVHRPGKTNVADYFSRHPVKAKRDEFLEEVRASTENERYINLIIASSLPKSLSIEDVREATKRDPELQALGQFLSRQNGKDHLPKGLSCYRPVFHELSLSDCGLLLRGHNIVVPEELRDGVVELAHVGHQEIVKTKRLVRSRLWYPGIDMQVERKIRMCTACQAIFLKEYLFFQLKKKAGGSMKLWTKFGKRAVEVAE